MSFLGILRFFIKFWNFSIPQTLREEIVNYLINVESINGEVVRDFSNIPWDDYIQQMDIEGTYGNSLTLRAFANIFNIEIEIVSTLGNDGRVSINPENSNPLERITLKHFAEGQGDNYVCLQREIAEGDETQQQDLDDIADDIAENNVEEIVPIRDEAKKVTSLEILPIDKTDKIFLYCLTTSGFVFPNNVCWRYNNAITIFQFLNHFNKWFVLIYLEYISMLVIINSIFFFINSLIH